MESVSLPEFTGFDRDEGNADKNWESHKVSPRKAEQVFSNRPLIVADDVKPSNKNDVPYQSLVKVFLSERIESPALPHRHVDDDLSPAEPALDDQPENLSVRNARRD